MPDPLWSTACPDWAEHLSARPQRSLIPFPPLYPAEAEAALDIFKALRIVDVAGRPTFGDVARPWILDFVAAIFGAYDADTGRRLIQYFMLLIAKKNGKSTLAAGTMITALVRNWRESGEFYILAPTKEIADNSYLPARDMALADPDLRSILKPSAGRVIEHRNTGAFLKVIAADSETVSGKKTIGLLVDELHIFGKRPNAESMLLEAEGGLASRPEGFVIYLSTQSDEIPAGIFKRKLEEFRQIREGALISRNRLPVLYEYPNALLEDKGYRDPTRWMIPNPNLGASVAESYIADKLEEGERSGRGFVNSVLAKHLNVEIGLGLRTDHWAGADFWEARADPGLTFAALLDRSEVIVVGIDGGGLDDLFGFAALGRDRETKHWLLFSHAWCHRGVLDRRKSISTRLEAFARAGELTIVDDRLDDISGIVALVEQINTRGLLGKVAVDPAGLGEFVDAMDAIDVTQDNEMLIGVGQGYRMMNAIKTAERRLASGTLWHGGGGLMAWCVGNLKIEATATAIRATKQNAGDAKIDPIMAAFNAIDIMSTNPEAIGGSIFDDDEAWVPVAA